uniref:Uncharacterized protein n=1 Tax=Arundo donax TaxID=35708 RepID=A0A0A9FK83_ARUDO
MTNMTCLAILMVMNLKLKMW